MKKILFLSCCLFLWSCEDFLVVEPDVQISTSEQLSTATGVEQAVSGIYRDVAGYLSDVRAFTYGDAIAGNQSFTPAVSSQNLSVPSTISLTYGFQNLPQESDFNSVYDEGYNIINQTNILMENMDSFDFFEPLKLQQLEAELLAIRAFIHYRLTLYYSQNYGFTGDGSHPGIVYVTKTLETGVDFPSRPALAQNYESIKQDLDAALLLFTETSFLDRGPARSYFNRPSTTAIYAQIALQMNDWQTAADFADDVISTTGVQLLSATNYLEQWELTTLPSEYILTFTAPVNGDGIVGSSVGGLFQYNSARDYDPFTASTDLIQTFETGDIRSSLYEEVLIPTNRDGSNNDLPYYFSTKYAGDSDTPYLRLTEIYFIKAEALERLSPGNSETTTIINQLRSRVGLLDLSSSTNLLEAILKERRLELAFENTYFYDLARYGRSIERGPDCELFTNVCTLNYPSPFFIQPLPADSIENNENMIQNDGY
jgi:hypothetical protein